MIPAPVNRCDYIVSCDDTDVARAYWLTDAKIDDLIAKFAPEAHRAHFSKRCGNAVMNMTCADCGVSAAATSRSVADSLISYHVTGYKPRPFRCRPCHGEFKISEFRRRANEDRQRRERIDQLRWMPYPEYLGTSEWAVRRRSVLERAGFRCQVCASDGKLHVHHRTYARRGSERREDMIALCADCHELFHTHGKLAEGGRAA